MGHREGLRGDGQRLRSQEDGLVLQEEPGLRCLH